MLVDQVFQVLRSGAPLQSFQVFRSFQVGALLQSFQVFQVLCYNRFRCFRCPATVVSGVSGALLQSFQVFQVPESGPYNTINIPPTPRQPVEPSTLRILVLHFSRLPLPASCLVGMADAYHLLFVRWKGDFECGPVFRTRLIRQVRNQVHMPKRVGFRYFSS